VKLIDSSTTDKYGASEEVLGKWFAANPDKREHIFLSTIKHPGSRSVPPLCTVGKPLKPHRAALLYPM
jgi:hypothetical protein